jgi:hypothetical protein
VSARIGEFLPRPAWVLALGLVASVDPGAAELALTLDPALAARAAVAAGIGVLFALAGAVGGAQLCSLVDLDRFRFGSAVALGVLGLAVLGLIPSSAPLPLAVFGLAAILAIDPDSSEDESEPTDAADQEAGQAVESEVHTPPWQ